MAQHCRILILDFGAQYTQLIARRLRETNVYCEIHPYDVGDDFVRSFGARGIVLSGGPSSVTEGAAPRAPGAVWELGVPILGICYGMQTMAAQLGGKTEGGPPREFGAARVALTGESKLWQGL
ncbi:MAG TPA: gamma-glutamyl-gamma-aminobutyrate hydrolase family protein, partial [Casimicrobiaceae bacterium]|nr:gamma-glutamyl-gamma-aminobutyrate hydrolase family protein [Casimicrobiaceae bacterium]